MTLSRESKSSGGTEISTKLPLKDDKGIYAERAQSKAVKWIRKVRKKIFLWFDTNGPWLFYRLYYDRLEVGHLRSDSLVTVAVGHQDGLPIQTHNSMKTGYCSNYFVLAVVSLPTACNCHSVRYPVFIIFFLLMLVVDSWKKEQKNT